MNNHSVDLVVKVAGLIEKRHLRKYSLSISHKMWLCAAELPDGNKIFGIGADLDEALKNFDQMLTELDDQDSSEQVRA